MGKGAFESRRVIHWSFYVQLTGSVVAAVASIAAYMFGPVAVAIGCAVAAATSLIGCYYLYKFSLYAALEEIVKKMASVISDLAGQNKIFTEENRRLEQNTEEFKQIVNKGHLQLQQKTQELASITERMEKSEQELKKFKNLGLQMAGQVKEITNGVFSFNEQNVRLKVHIEELDRQSAKMREHVNQIEAQTNNLDEDNAIFDQENEELTVSLQFLQKQLSLMEQVHSTDRAELARLSKEVQLLKEVGGNAKLLVDQMKESEEKMELTDARLAEKVERMRVLSDLLKKWDTNDT